jgi:helix-turn-helix protein
MGERTDHARNVFAWLNQLLGDRDLTGFAVAFCIAQHVNHNTGEGYPSAKRIATKTGLSESTVLAAIDRLELRGHLAIERGKQGRGHSNRYRMLIKPRPADVLDAGKPRPADVLQGAKNLGQPKSKTSASRTENLGQPEIKPRPAEVNNLREQLGEPLRMNKGALRAPVCARAHTPQDVQTGEPEDTFPETHRRHLQTQAVWRAHERGEILEDEATRQVNAILKAPRNQQANGQPPKQRAQVKRPPEDDWPSDYRNQFWDAYPQKVGKKPALAALARIRRNGKTTWAELIDGLHHSLHHHRHGGALYRIKWPNPENWLRDERWNDRPAD